MKKDYYIGGKYWQFGCGIIGHRWYVLPALFFGIYKYDCIVGFYILSFYFELYWVTKEGRRVHMSCKIED